ncbi:diguanylate cyclase with GAF sensor [Devosia sp. YR412]|uniref:sensor domain-containing diguanylate cyclase n=1 Tax=Devosia sp. YR412 TaxID=1881030 RepID=UPI0008C885B9|nr:sensor domain-containing diguanylate cyclase [Devosia sp. YR412]SEQ05270.1 diguanylate cyclase with GAF sensor [Devosia sp. YR412]
MQPASVLESIPQIGDEGRLAALDRYDILDTGQEEAFDRISRLIRLTLNVDIGLVSLMDAHRQWYKSIEGLDGAEVPLNVAFCRYMLDDGQPFIVPDAEQDPRFSDNPFVTGPAHIRSYAGAPLRTPDGFVIGSVCAVGSTARDFSPREQAILAELAGIAMDQIELRQIAAVDSLTGISTRRAFKDDAQKFVTLAKRHRSALSCVSFDIDHFKSVNDAYGHAGGDQVLSAVARAAAAQLRQSDLLGRLGGEEFAVLLPHTDGARALEVADKLRLLFRSLTFPGSHPPISISASFGVAMLDPNSDDIDSLLQKADEALYEAKRSGRNKCTVWRPSGRQPEGDRRRVLKAGQIIFNDRHSTMDCTIRALGETSAEFTVPDAHNVPETFTLRIVSDGLEWPCRVTGRTEQRVTVAFG